MKVRKEAEGVVKEAKTREQEMQALRLEVEELEKAVQTQQQQVGGGKGWGEVWRREEGGRGGGGGWRKEGGVSEGGDLGIEV